MLRLKRVFFIGLAAATCCATAPAGQAQTASLTAAQMESAVRSDEFTIPTPGEFMAALSKTGKPDWASKARPPIPTNFASRAQQAMNLGTLIADGYIAVEAEDKQAVKNIGKDIVEISKPLGVKDEIIARGKSLTEFAEDGQWDVLREELESTQNEVKVKFAASADKDLVTLITMGGWVRGLEVVSALVAQNYSEEGARLLRQPGIADLLHAKLDALPVKLRDDPAVKRTRAKLVELKAAVSFPADTTPDAGGVKAIHALAAELVKDLSRKDLK